jgi:DNA processing protein
MKQERIYQIAVTLIPGIGDVIGKRFIAYCGGVEAIFKETRSSLEKIKGLREPTIEALCHPKPLFERAEQEIAFLEKNCIQPLFYQDPDYPQRLLQCDDGPMMLYYKGNANLNAERVVPVTPPNTDDPAASSWCKT